MGMKYFPLFKTGSMNRIICGYFSIVHGWVRILGIGISWKNRKKVPILFSQRYGYKKYLIIGYYDFHFLPYVKSKL